MNKENEVSIVIEDNHRNKLYVKNKLIRNQFTSELELAAKIAFTNDNKSRGD